MREFIRMWHAKKEVNSVSLTRLFSEHNLVGYCNDAFEIYASVLGDIEEPEKALDDAEKELKNLGYL